MAEQDEKNIIAERTKEYGQQLWGIVQKQIDKQSEEKQISSTPLSPPKKESKHKVLLKLLFLFPLLLIGTFIGSFYWDFNGVQTTVLGVLIEFEGLMRILSISGLIGFLTNWLAITMLFRPAKKKTHFWSGFSSGSKRSYCLPLSSCSI